MDIRKESLKRHYKWHGKIEIKSRVKVSDAKKLSLAYTPGVAESCIAIEKDPNLSFELTRRWNTVPVITDGTAVLGLGDIGPLAGMPVMEGKCALFKEFGDVDAYPLCINSKDTDTIVNTIKLLSGSWGGVNLEDIAAPRCFEIEKRLIDELDIPVFHDDQHGTAIVVAGALINALKLANKKLESIKVVINGAGAAGISIAKFLLKLGVNDIILCDKFGIIAKGDKNLNDSQKAMAEVTNLNNLKGRLALAMKNRDVFIGVSGPNCVSKEMVESMNEKAIIFTLANPVPEINPKLAKEANAFIVGSGSSVYPNQINNALVFPGLFRGALDAKAKKINDEMMIAAAYAIASYVKEPTVDYILPFAYDKEAHKYLASKVKEAALNTNA